MPNAGAQSPRVSVLTAVYNGERYLSRALESVRRQTFSNFEHVIVDDASTDGSWALLLGAQDDSRCLPERLSHNTGPAAALNHALARARGEYVAIFDHDDECAPERLALQVDYLDAHPEVGVLGTLGYRIDGDSVIIKDAGIAEDDAYLRWLLHFGTPFIHPSVTMRTEMLRSVGGYVPSFRSILDYDLWLRLAPHTCFAVLPHRLTMYRDVTTGISRAGAVRQRAQMAMRHQAWLKSSLGITTTLPIVTALYTAVRKQHMTPADTAEALSLLIEISRRHIDRNVVFDEDAARISANCAKRCRDIADANATDPAIVALCNAARAVYEPVFAEAGHSTPLDNRSLITQ